MKAMMSATALVSALLFFAGCSCQMTGIAPSSTPITSEDTYTIIGPVTASSGGVLLAGLLPLCADKPSNKCLEKALKKSGGDALIEVTEDTTMILIPYIYPYWTRLQGTAVKIERGGGRQ